MLGLTIAHISALLVSHGYFILLPVSIIEGPIVAIIAGFLVSIGILNFYLTFIVLLLGDIIGDIIFYYLGLIGRHTFVKKWGKYVGISEARVEKISPHFHNHTWKILLFGKTHPLGSAILFSAGVAKMSFKKFLFINSLASCVKVVIFIYVGIYFGQAATSIQKYFNYASLISVIIIIILIGIYFGIKKYLSNSNKDLKI